MGTLCEDGRFNAGGASVVFSRLTPFLRYSRLRKGIVELLVAGTPTIRKLFCSSSGFERAITPTAAFHIPVTSIAKRGKTTAILTLLVLGFVLLLHLLLLHVRVSLPPVRPPFIQSVRPTFRS